MQLNAGMVQAILMKPTPSRLYAVIEKGAIYVCTLVQLTQTPMLLSKQTSKYQFLAIQIF